MSTPFTINRRSALGAVGAIVLGGVFGFVLARNSAAAKQPNGMTAANAYGNSPAAGKALLALAAIPANGGVILNKPPVVITRTGRAVHAFSAICTHQGCHVNRVAGRRIFCPCHGSVFDAVTGRVVAGPAPRPLPPVRISVRNGEVYPL
jgi:Rieske Fe-S protein